MDKSVTVKFWQINETEDAAPFPMALDACLKRPAGSKTLTIDGITLQFEPQQRTSNSPDPYVADVIRLQDSALPSILEKGGKAKKFKLEICHYLGHHSAFIYDDETRLFGIEIRPAAAGLGRTLDLIKALSRFDGYFPVPVVTKSKLAELTNAKSGTFSFKIADPSSLETADPDLGTIRDSLKELKGMVDGTYMKVSIGVGRRHRGLDRLGILRLGGWLSSERDAERGGIKSVRVNQPNDNALLDFIKGQVQSKETLQFTEDPETDWKLRSDFLHRALVKARRHVNKFPKRN